MFNYNYSNSEGKALRGSLDLSNLESRKALEGSEIQNKLEKIGSN